MMRNAGLDQYHSAVSEKSAPRASAVIGSRGGSALLGTPV